MADDLFDAGAYADTASAAIGLAIDPAFRPGVVQNLELLHRMAALVMDFPLPEDTEPAPVFRP